MATESRRPHLLSLRANSGYTLIIAQFPWWMNLGNQKNAFAHGCISLYQNSPFSCTTASGSKPALPVISKYSSSASPGKPIMISGLPRMSSTFLVSCYVVKSIGSYGLLFKFTMGRSCLPPSRPRVVIMIVLALTKPSPKPSILSILNLIETFGVLG